MISHFFPDDDVEENLKGKLSFAYYTEWNCTGEENLNYQKVHTGINLLSPVTVRSNNSHGYEFSNSYFEKNEKYRSKLATAEEWYKYFSDSLYVSLSKTNRKSYLLRLRLSPPCRIFIKNFDFNKSKSSIIHLN